MPERATRRRAAAAKRSGKSPSTQAGEFIREEIHNVREGKHGAHSPEQAIAIGLSKARRAGIRVPPKGPSRKGGGRRRAKTTSRARGKPSPKRAQATPCPQA